ncbi:trimethyllysine dioxygenase [Ophiostoma piceae UAMH 11346]|uniref:trimethyllysine dioxygenase n=1 Tax=Ophiostoma piceae (strain UAMH 11346) TaxID=1262450 RepID=S3BPJ6_OPHP1|nr:trimethyllysine dioxygenase [Ophiostoma piceae UAMH 11346]
MPIRFRAPVSLGLHAPAGMLSPSGASRAASRLSSRTAAFSHPCIPAGRQIARAFSGAAQVSASDHSVKIVSSEAAKRAELDNCRCASCVNQDTSQRNFDTFKIPSSIRASEASADDKGLNIVWSGDNHKSHYPWDFVRFYQNNDYRSPEEVDFKYWSSAIAKEPPTVSYDAVMDTSEAGIAKLTDLIRRYGFAFVDGTPYEDPTDTERLLERIAFIRVTHYGGFYDFVPDLAMADTAYTNLPLPAHTDNTYFTDPAGLQAFHLLSHHAPPTENPTETLGGASILVDGFYAAGILRKEDPDAFDILSRVRLPWHASGNQGITISPDRRYPVFELLDEQDRDASGKHNSARLNRVRWNNDDRGIVPFGGPDADGIDPVRWYEAARKWSDIIKRPDVEYTVQLKPGRPLIFDNWRVMHGRQTFVGVRRMCGGYINRDDFISRWRNTNYPRGQVLNQVVG